MRRLDEPVLLFMALIIDFSPSHSPFVINCELLGGVLHALPVLVLNRLGVPPIATPSKASLRWMLALPSALSCLFVQRCCLVSSGPCGLVLLELLCAFCRIVHDAFSWLWGRGAPLCVFPPPGLLVQYLAIVGPFLLGCDPGL